MLYQVSVVYSCLSIKDLYCYGRRHLQMTLEQYSVKMCGAIFALIAFLKISVIVAPDTGIADYLPVEIKAPHGSQSANMQVKKEMRKVCIISLLLLGFSANKGGASYS